MDIATLEQILDGAEETDTLDFRQAMCWDSRTFVKDILAMANVIDGGRIIVGVEDGTFTRQGLTEDEIASYDLEIMRDQIAPYADPYVSFRCEIVADAQGLQYAVIEISRFEEMPVICRRDGQDVHAGAVYFRSRAGRPQSAPVRTSEEMRSIIEASVSRRMRRLERLGFVARLEAGYDYDDELGGL